MDRSVTVGIGTVVGFAASAAAAIIPIVGELADAVEPLGVPNSVWVIISAVLTAITVLGRMWQAAAAAQGGGGVITIPEPPPTEGGAGEPPV